VRERERERRGSRVVYVQMYSVGVKDEIGSSQSDICNCVVDTRGALHVEDA
jgi:hypothetical protein